MFNILSHQGNMNQNDSESILPIRMAKIKNTDDSSCWKGCGVRETSIAGGSTNLYNYSGNQYGGFSENWESTYCNTTLGHIPKGCSIIPQGHLLNYVRSSIICNSQNLETAQMSLNQRMDKENVVHLHNKVKLSCKKQ